MQISFKSEKSNLKEKTPKDLQSGVIYRIPCLDCEGVYIGQTGRYLKTRLTEHQRSVKPSNFASSSTKTALAEHAFGEFHRFDFDSTENCKLQKKISSRNDQYKKRKKQRK